MSSEVPNPYAPPPNISMDVPFDPAVGNLATRGERFAGALLDGLIMLPLAFVGGFVLGILMVTVGIDPDSVAFQVGSSIIGLVLGMTIFLVLNGYLLANRGQTIGKYIMKTQIVSEDGRQLPIASLVLKRYLPIWVASSIPIVGGFLAIIDSVAIFRGNRKCIHDDIAGTKVIKL